MWFPSLVGQILVTTCSFSEDDMANPLICRLAPYERRVIELLRNSKDKRARKLAKKRLGTFGRAKSKVDELQRVIAESRRAGH